MVLPAFGVTVAELQRLSSIGCTLVDTTCGSVLNVWKNVSRYARDGYTSVIHGKFWHEETQATASQATQVPGGHYLVVLDRAEATAVCDYIRRSASPDPALRAAFLERFERATSPGFDPDLHLARIGCANQTTMLSTESLEVGELFRQAMRERYGEAELTGALPQLRHHLQRDPGPPGRRRQAAGRRTGRPDAGDWRLQQQQHLQSGPNLRRARADLSRGRT